LAKGDWLKFRSEFDAGSEKNVKFLDADRRVHTTQGTKPRISVDGAQHSLPTHTKLDRFLNGFTEKNAPNGIHVFLQ